MGKNLTQYKMDTMEWEELQIKETGIGGGWNHPEFDKDIKEFDTMIFIISRKDRVAEGILECKCGSKRVERVPKFKVDLGMKECRYLPSVLFVERDRKNEFIYYPSK